MDIHQLYILLLPLIEILIDFLGTICLIALMAAGTLYVLSRLLRALWKYLLTAGVILAAVISMGFALGVL